MSGGQDEASEQINTSDLPYWLAGPIKQLEARVERLERYDPELLLAKIACLEQGSDDRRQRLTPEQRNAMLDEPKPAKHFRITGPGKYRTRNGEVFDVEGPIPGAKTFRWQGTRDGLIRTWTDAGLFDWRFVPSDHDLVARINEPATAEPAKRREWWGVPPTDKYHGFLTESFEDAGTLASSIDPNVRPVRVIAAPSEAEIGEAVEWAVSQFEWWSKITAKAGMNAAIRKLLGGE